MYFTQFTILTQFAIERQFKMHSELPYTVRSRVKGHEVEDFYENDNLPKEGNLDAVQPPPIDIMRKALPDEHVLDKVLDTVRELFVAERESSADLTILGIADGLQAYAEFFKGRFCRDAYFCWMRKKEEDTAISVAKSKVYNFTRRNIILRKKLVYLMQLNLDEDKDDDTTFFHSLASNHEWTWLYIFETDLKYGVLHPDTVASTLPMRLGYILSLLNLSFVFAWREDPGAFDGYVPDLEGPLTRIHIEVCVYEKDSKRSIRLRALFQSEDGAFSVI